VFETSAFATRALYEAPRAERDGWRDSGHAELREPRVGSPTPR
jgi:hypothetical protein